MVDFEERSLTSVYVRRNKAAKTCLRPLLGVSLPSAFLLFVSAPESCRAAVSYRGLQSIFTASPPSPLRCICIAAKAIMALRTTGASAAMAPKNARVEAHFGPRQFVSLQVLRSDLNDRNVPISTGVKIGGMSICRKVLTSMSPSTLPLCVPSCEKGDVDAGSCCRPERSATA